MHLSLKECCHKISYGKHFKIHNWLRKYSLKRKDEKDMKVELLPKNILIIIFLRLLKFTKVHRFGIYNNTM